MNGGADGVGGRGGVSRLEHVTSWSARKRGAARGKGYAAVGEPSRAPAAKAGSTDSRGKDPSLGRDIPGEPAESACR